MRLRVLRRSFCVTVALLSSLVLTLVVATPPRIQAARLAGGASWQLLIDSDFSANVPAGWPIGHGLSYDEGIGAGRYTLRVPDGQTHDEAPTGAPPVSDGSILAVVRPDGRGQVGISARLNAAADTGYAFWIDRQGRCGGIRRADGSATTLFGFYSAAIVPNGDNTLTVQIARGRLTFAVNGRPVYDEIDRQPLPVGTWGIYARSEPGDGPTTGRYARVTLYGDPVARTQDALPTGPFQAALDYDFSLGDDYSWYTGRYAHGSVSIGAGLLTIAMTDNYQIFRSPAEAPRIADGQVDAIVRLQGAGRVGVTGRALDNPDRHYSLYACWFDHRGYVGLTRDADGDVVTPIVLHSSRVHPYQDNTIVLRIQGNRISCYADGARVLTYSDALPLRPGHFGAYVSDYPGGPYVQGQYARILVAD